MTVKERTQVGIVGAGPAGLLLAHLLSLGGVESRLVENRSQAHCLKRQRAATLEPWAARLLRDAGLGTRLEAEGLERDGIYLQFDDRRYHLDLCELTGGKKLTLYPQTKIVQDIIAARTVAGNPPEFGVEETSLRDMDTDLPVLRYVDHGGELHEVTCDVIAGCDGFRGITRAAIPVGGLRTLAQRIYPFNWLGILAEAAPSADQVIYARHDRGFALHSMWSPEVSSLYIQVSADDDVTEWPDDRVWAEVSARLAVPGWEPGTGMIIDKSITATRAFIAAPMRHGRLFLAGDAAHVIPQAAAKGLNLAVADVSVLATALISMLGHGEPELANAYSDICLQQAWRAMSLSVRMTDMLHVMPRQDPFASGMQLAQLRNLVSSRPAASALADSCAGAPPLPFDPSPAGLAPDMLAAGGCCPARGA